MSPACGGASCVASASAVSPTGVHVMFRACNACCSGITWGRLPATRNSTASANGSSPCGDSVAGRPRTRSVGTSSPARSSRQRMAGSIPSLSLNNVSVCIVNAPPRAVTRSVTSMPSPPGRREAGASPSVYRTMPSLPLNIVQRPEVYGTWLNRVLQRRHGVVSPLGCLDSRRQAREGASRGARDNTARRHASGLRHRARALE
eukprot:2001651-Pleurochrysis_carterae.AAC.1